MGKNKALLKETIDFLKQNRKWWLAPLLIMLAVIAGLIIAGSAVSQTPFIYILF